MYTFRTCDLGLALYIVFHSWKCSTFANAAYKLYIASVQVCRKIVFSVIKTAITEYKNKFDDL